MERLTHIDHAGWYVDDQSIAFDERRRGKDVDRLAAYENTGLEPEEVTTEPYGCVFYCNRKCNLDGDFCAEGPGCPNEIGTETAKHLLELAKAEKDGRLVALDEPSIMSVLNKRGIHKRYREDIAKELDGELSRACPEDISYIRQDVERIVNRLKRIEEARKDGANEL